MIACQLRYITFPFPETVFTTFLDLLCYILPPRQKTFQTTTQIIKQTVCGIAGKFRAHFSPCEEMSIEPRVTTGFLFILFFRAATHHSLKSVLVPVPP